MNPRLLLLIGIVAAGLLIAVWQPVDLDTLFHWGERFTGNPLALLLIILIQGLLFTFALPGSTLVWVVAPFQAPWISVPVLIAGSLLGALGAHLFADRLTRNWQPGGQAQAIIDLLEKRGDVLTQIALRALPGFPHSVVNYAGGLLRLPLPGYITAVVIGLGCKWSVYAVAIYGIGSAAQGEDALSVWQLLPLFLLAGLFLLAAWLRPRLMGKRH
ncbi:VTT domain-containing protein [Natronospira bacteriovora]|uniref:VTT domain-containing protein n=1 Tax=Natronospira bacteriovora TaxID=3069753 RepID=A0ABU0W485_9GAMM|nr:VTT domain-containing protein [Natronospira sp. AB-CW4]MDQ2068831.1 VTT domain-containing protein [Natronospira sp. AB-CW4]